MKTNPKDDYYKYYQDAMAFWEGGKIIQHSDARLNDSQSLSVPIIYLFRHASELLIKGLIIRDADCLYEMEINEVMFSPHNRQLSQMHSLKALFETWIEIRSILLVPKLSNDVHKKITRIIQRIEDCDPFSTFFRYPFTKNGEENSRLFVTPVNDEMLSEIPCCIRAIIGHEGVENFRCWAGDEKVSWLEFDLDSLIRILVSLYTGDAK